MSDLLKITRDVDGATTIDVSLRPRTVWFEVDGRDDLVGAVLADDMPQDGVDPGEARVNVALNLDRANAERLWEQLDSALHGDASKCGPP